MMEYVITQLQNCNVHSYKHRARSGGWAGSTIHHGFPGSDARVTEIFDFFLGGGALAHFLHIIVWRGTSCLQDLIIKSELYQT